MADTTALEEQFLSEPARRTPIAAEVDVLVAGAGPSGYGAALAAARMGASTLVVEKNGVPGGTSTAVLMNAWKCPVERLTGASKEVANALIKRGAAYAGGHINFDPEALIEIELESLTAAGARILLHTWVVEPIMADQRIRGVILQGKSGRQAVLAKAVVDATGDGDVAYLAGAPSVKGREEDGKMRSASSLFRVAGVDMGALLAYCRKNPDQFHKDRARHNVSPDSQAFGIVGFYSLVEEGRRRGELPDEVHFLTFEGWDQEHGITTINSSRVYDMDGTNMWDVSRGEIEARRQNKAIFRFMKQYVPGCKDCYVISSSSMLGVRETRRILGEHFLTDDDMIAEKTYATSVAKLWRYINKKKGYDGHSPDGKEGAPEDADHHSTGRSLRWYELPYGVVVPKDIDGLTVGGRIISQSREADWWTRGQYCCMITGQIAGTAAALAAAANTVPRNLDVSLVQRALLQQGVDIGEAGAMYREVLGA